MKRKRLLIDEIDSVGGVDAGDNPGATLLFWKRKRTPDPGDDQGVLMDGETVAVEEAEEVAKLEPVEAEIAAEEPVEADELAKRQEEIVKAIAERDAAVQALAEEVEKRENAEWIGKAEPYTLLLGDPNQVGPALRKIHLLAPDAYAILEPALKAASSRESLAKILAEFGSDVGQASPEDSKDAFVKDMRRLHPEMTVEQARALFWREHPEAVKASRERI
jgi:hypothetical protein